MFLQNYGVGVDEFLHKATFQITRATHLAWTRKFDENLKQGGVMRIRKSDENLKQGWRDED